jgi:hypothetical protein
MIRASDEIYHTLERILGNVKYPLTLNELYDIPEVREAVDKRWKGRDVQGRRSQFSNLLGFMWRKNTIDRFPAPPMNSPSARKLPVWAYAKRGLFQSDPNQNPTKNPIEEYKPKPDQIVTRHKGDMKITEKNGELIIQLKSFTIVIKPR